MLTWRSVWRGVSSGAVIGLLTASTVRAADIYVADGGSLQAAIDRAQPGDRILLQPGATFLGNFRLTNKGSSDAFITIRSAAPDLALPGDGVRIRPADAVNLPVIKSPNTSPALTAAAAAHHWRLKWLEFQANDRGYGDIITLGKGDSTQTLLSQVPHDLVLDRVYVHGDPVIGQKRGIALHSGATWILNSYISDIKAVGMDTQAILGYNGPGPWTIVNNYLEASGENVMLGGASPKIDGLVPSDIEFRRNHLFKPLSWRQPILTAPAGVRATPDIGGSLPQGTFSYRVLAARRTAQDSWVFSPRSLEVVATTTAGGRVTLSWTAVPNATTYRVYRGSSPGAQDRYFDSTGTTFVDDGTLAGVADTGSSKNGTVWTVKNLFELKLGSRVLVDGNVMENSWLDAQTGYAVLFTPRNQDKTSPWIYVRDVTFTNNVVRHAAAGIAIEGYDSNGICQQTQRITVRNNLFDDISAKNWGGSGRFIQIGNQPRDITIDHNTVVHDGPFIFVYGGSYGAELQVVGLVATNNLARHNAYGIVGNARGYGNDTIRAYFPDSIIQRNTLAGGKYWLYPAGNEFPTVAYWQSQFVDFAAPDYHLVSGSPYVASGTDGADLGAPMSHLEQVAALAIGGGTATATAPAFVQIMTESLPDGQVGAPYVSTLAAVGGSGTYAWSVVAGQLPPGLTLTTGGVISGTPTAGTVATLTVRADDAGNLADAASATFTLRVNAAPMAILTSALPSGLANASYITTMSAAGGVAPYAWRVSGGSLPPGLGLTSTGTLSGIPTVGGAFTVTIEATDGSAPSLTAERSFALEVAAAPTVTMTTPVDGSAITGADVQLAAAATDSDGSVVRVDFYAGTVLVGSATAAPWTAAWSNVAAGAYALSAIATDDSGLTATSASVTVTVGPLPATQPPAPAGGRIVIHAADAAHLVGRWAKVADATAASGYKLSNTDAGLEAATADPEPSDYFETTFTAPSATPYRMWVRMRAKNNGYANDSLWVQFSDAITPSGQPLYRIGTANALLLSLEACSRCGVSGWGWMDAAFWLPQTEITFAGGGTHVVRVQMRQDGAEVDQIVLVPMADGGAAPGPARNDTTILPRTAEAPTDIVVYAADLPASALHGTWLPLSSSTSPGGLALVTGDRDTNNKSTPLASPSDYVDVTVPAAKDTPYRVWLRMRATKDSYTSDSVWVQYSDALVDGSPVWKLSTTAGAAFSLQPCGGCGFSGWGWVDGAHWNPRPAITFSYSGLHTLRIQMREDGAQIDQIVLSPERYLSTSPGLTADDATMVEKP